MFIKFHTKENQIVLEEVKRLCLTENCIAFLGTANSIYFESTEIAQKVLNDIGRAIEQGNPLYNITHEVTL